MLGRIPPFVLGPVGVLLVLAAAGAGYWFMVKPTQAQIGTVQANIDQERSKADQREEAEKAKEEVEREWVTAHESLAQKLDERSIPLSMGHPFVAMVNIWREVREDLPQLVEKFVAESGCVIVQGHPGWEPPRDPLATSAEWLELPIGTGGGTLGGGADSPMWIAGTLADIERLYKSLRNFPRVLTIRHLGLVRLRELMDTALYDRVREMLDKPEDEILVAPLYMTIWLACETPAGGAAAGAAAGGGGGMPGGGMPGGGMPGGGMGGPGGPPGGGGMPGGPPGGAGAGGPPGGPGGDAGGAPAAGPPGGGGGDAGGGGGDME